MKSIRKKLLFTTGGTGGHIFPAQTLASELLEKGYEILFVGGGLNTNRYFNRNQFAFRTVCSATPFKGNVFKSFYLIAKGIYQSLKILKQFNPDIVIGFGSFYSFPLLAAAYWKKIPFVLFEPNAVAGKVNKIFSKRALCSVVQFPQTFHSLKGKIIEVKMVVGKKKKEDPAIAKAHFYLDPGKFTFLIFGGSQGSQFIDRLFYQTALQLSPLFAFQVIHITGNLEMADFIREHYGNANIKACVKVFEERMDLAWSAADAVICRAGGSTIAEQIVFEVPGILIPFPQALDDHQTKNASFLEDYVGGAIACQQHSLTQDKFKQLIEQFLTTNQIKNMQESIITFKSNDQKKTFSHLICEILGEKE